MKTSAVTQESTSNSLRYRLLFGLLILALLGLGARMVLLVHADRSGAYKLLDRQQRMLLRFPGRTGSIYGRAGNAHVPLAVSRQVPSCYIDASLIDDREVVDTARRVASAVGADPAEVEAVILARRDRRFAWVKRAITPAQAEAVRALRIPAVGIVQEWRREYPNERLASTVVGFRLRDGSPGGGLELAKDRALRGRDGWRIVLADARRRPVQPGAHPARPPRDGASVLLFLDLVIQEELEKAVRASVEEFGALWGAGVVVDPQTGRVLAACSVPDFNPNRFTGSDPEERLNRAIACPYEPGSVVKPVFAAGTVDAGLLKYDSKIFCENGLYHPRRGGRIRDHGRRYGTLSLTDVVVHSSNIGMAKVGEVAGNRRLWAIARQFGFGSRTGIELPGESAGIVRPRQQWNGYSLRRVPFGQEISVTTLQLGMAFSAIANGGLLLRPRLVDRVVSPSGEVLYRSRREVVCRVLRPEVAAETLEVLRQVVLRGTGKACRLDGWSSFGKTGTAQVPGPDGYEDGAYTGTFVGGAPVRCPRLICVISIYRPDAQKGYYGSVVAAPYVRDVLQRSLSYLNVPTDAPEPELAAR